MQQKYLRQTQNIYISISKKLKFYVTLDYDANIITEGLLNTPIAWPGKVLFDKHLNIDRNFTRNRSNYDCNIDLIMIIQQLITTEHGVTTTCLEENINIAKAPFNIPSYQSGSGNLSQTHSSFLNNKRVSRTEDGF